MSTTPDPIDRLLWIPVLVPALHGYTWLMTAPWRTIDLRIDGFSVSLTKIVTASLHAVTHWSPSPLVAGVMLLWAVLLGAHVLLRPRSTGG